MAKRTLAALGGLILAGGAFAQAAPKDRQDGLEAARIALRGAHFVPNHGQWPDNSARYGLRSRGADIAFRESSLTIHLHPPAPGQTLRVDFPGSNPVPPRGHNPGQMRFNYFIGDDRGLWAAGVPPYAAVAYDNLYDDVDLYVMGADGLLKYEFHCAPGADHTQIRVRYDGADALCVGPSGDLHIQTPLGALVDQAPRVWQETGAARREIPARFELLDRRTYTIRLLADPDPSLPLVIDPEVRWMTYLGGSGDDGALAITVDGEGNALITGSTRSLDFSGQTNPFNSGVGEAFVLKLSSNGRLQWITYLGGGSQDIGTAIAADQAGNGLLTGWTASPDFAAATNSHHGGGRDAFALKVDPDGRLLWMTYLGGSDTDIGLGIAADGAGHALVVGTTASHDFVAAGNTYHGGAADAFIARVDTEGGIQRVIFLGGSGHDWGEAVAIDDAGNTFVTGETGSADFTGAINTPYGAPAIGDAYVVKVDRTGQVDWMTYIGGTDRDWGEGIALDDSGHAFVVGHTRSTDFAGALNRHRGAIDMFAVKASPAGDVQWMTYLGGRGNDQAKGIALDASGNAVIAGWTTSADFSRALNAYHGGFRDSCVLLVDAAGHLRWMTHLGGSGDEPAFGLALDGEGSAFVAGWTDSADFVGRTNSRRGGRRDAFVLKLRLDAACYPD